VNSVSSAWAPRRYRFPLGNAARATRAASGGMGPIGIGRSRVHLRVSVRNHHNAEAAYQCVQDFASSIKIDEDPRNRDEIRTGGVAKF